MGSLSPVAVALAIVSLVGFVGAIIAFVKRSATFHGYKELVKDAREIARLFRGSVYREDDELVIEGNMGAKLPVTVRFSQREDTPGLTIRMEMPATFQMTIVPQGSPQAAGKVIVRLGDMQFDNRFTARSDQPNQVRMLLSSRGVSENFQKLCCSGRTFLSVERGVMELSELVIPNQYVARHVTDHLKQMAHIANEMAQIPGAEDVKIQPIRSDRNLVARGAIAIGVIAAIGMVIVGYEDRQQPISALAAESKTMGVDPADARLIPQAAVWHESVPTDFDPNAVTWARNNNIQISRKVEADFSGTGEGRDYAYILHREADNTFRIVILEHGENRFDVNYENVAVVVPFPKRLLTSVQWVGRPPEDPDGDGLLIAYRPGDPTASVVIFTKGNRIVSGAPANYQTINY